MSVFTLFVQCLATVANSVYFFSDFKLFFVNLLIKEHPKLNVPPIRAISFEKELLQRTLNLSYFCILRVYKNAN